MKCTNCGKELVPGVKFCASCGTEAQSEVTTPVVAKPKKTKKIFARVIGSIAVVAVIGAVVFGGCRVWQMLHKDVTKQLVYVKNGSLYYTGNMDKEKEPIKIYDADDDYAAFTIRLSEDQKYLFFKRSTDDKNRLYRIETQKLTSDELKNEKYIEKIDDKVEEFEAIGSGNVLYKRSLVNDEYDLCYYDGEKVQDIDDDVYKHFCEGNIVYYFKNYNSSENSALLCYYSLNNQKQGEISEDCDVANNTIVMGENAIVFTKYAGVEDDNDYGYGIQKYDLYMANPGGKETKIVSDIVGFNCDLDSETIYYTKLHGKKHSYYEFVDDPYEKQDSEVSEPDIYDYGLGVDPYELLDYYEYEYYYEYYYDYPSGYFQDYGYYDEDLDEYVIEMYGYKYIAGESGDLFDWFCVTNEREYAKALKKYNKAYERDDLRYELENMTFGSYSFDLYFYNGKSGETKIVESVSSPYMDAKNQLCSYSKIKELKVEKVCSIDELDSVEDMTKYLQDYDNSDDAVYIVVGTKEQKMDGALSNIRCSEDGKIVVAHEKTNAGNKLINFVKKDSNLEQQETIDENVLGGYFVGNNYYYFKKDGEFYVYSNGESKKIAEHVDSLEVQEDGYYMIFNKKQSDNSYDLKVMDSNGELDTIRDIDGQQKCGYIDKNHIVYLKSGDLYLYNGEDSNKIDREVSDFWCTNKLSGVRD